MERFGIELMGGAGAGFARFERLHEPRPKECFVWRITTVRGARRSRARWSIGEALAEQLTRARIDDARLLAGVVRAYTRSLSDPPESPVVMGVGMLRYFEPGGGDAEPRGQIVWELEELLLGLQVMLPRFLRIQNDASIRLDLRPALLWPRNEASVEAASVRAALEAFHEAYAPLVGLRVEVGESGGTIELLRGAVALGLIALSALGDSP